MWWSIHTQIQKRYVSKHCIQCYSAYLSHAPSAGLYLGGVSLLGLMTPRLVFAIAPILQGALFLFLAGIYNNSPGEFFWIWCDNISKNQRGHMTKSAKNAKTQNLLYLLNLARQSNFIELFGPQGTFARYSAPFKKKFYFQKWRPF